MTLTQGCLVYRPEAAIALRQRLNETVDQLDELRKGHAELEVKYDTANRELTIAKSDREWGVVSRTLNQATSLTRSTASHFGEQGSAGHPRLSPRVCQRRQDGIGGRRREVEEAEQGAAREESYATRAGEQSLDGEDQPADRRHWAP